MLYKILSCDFAKIKCGTTTFPLVIAHLDFNNTYANGNEFITDLLRISKGMITISAIAYRGNNAVSVSGLNDGMIATGTTIGDSNGFKIVKTAQWTGGWAGIYRCDLFFNDIHIAQAETAVGWNDSYDLAPIIVFCDTGYNVLELTARLCNINVSYVGYAPLQYTYGLDLDFDTINDMVVWGEPTTNVIANIDGSIEIYSSDPYSNGGDSTISEMTGDFDGTSDPIDFPSLPTLGAVDSGFITLFNPDLTELQDLAKYMWTNPLFDVSAWKKIFADPMDAILGLSIVPVAVPEGSSRPIIVGNIVTDVSMKVATAQFVEVQCGSLNVNEFWSAYLDYEPYTKAEIYLPFCGVHQISVDDIMGKTVEVRYHIDILSGACCAFVKCGESVLYQFIGQCSSSIPISGNDFTNVINGVLSATTAIGSLVATGGASAPLAVPALSATALNTLKPNIEKSGAMGGTGGMLAIKKPYLVLTRPKQAHPKDQNHYTGYPSFITENLGDLNGYTEIEKIHLEGVPATDEELSEIETLLKGGVIL